MEFEIKVSKVYQPESDKMMYMARLFIELENHITFVSEVKDNAKDTVLDVIDALNREVKRKGLNINVTG